MKKSKLALGLAAAIAVTTMGACGTATGEDTKIESPAVEVKAEVILSEDGTVATGIKNKDEATYLEISEGVTEIGESAFAGCTKLETVKLPEGIKTIGDEAFSECKKMKEINWPESLEYYGADSFGLNTSLTHVEFSKNAKEIENAFFGCVFTKDQIVNNSNFSLEEIEDVSGLDVVDKIENGLGIIGNKLVRVRESEIPSEIVEIPEGIEEIGDLAFAYCENIKEIKVPDYVKSIGAGSFMYCENLEKLELPSSGIEIEDLFALGKVKSVTLPSNIEVLGEDFFAYSECLEEVVLPDSLEEISDKAFYGTKQLKKIVIPEGVKKIGAAAFFDSGIEELTLPDGIEQVDSVIFDSASSLKRIMWKGKTFKNTKEFQSFVYDQGCEVVN